MTKLVCIAYRRVILKLLRDADLMLEISGLRDGPATIVMNFDLKLLEMKLYLFILYTKF